MRLIESCKLTTSSLAALYPVLAGARLLKFNSSLYLPSIIVKVGQKLVSCSKKSQTAGGSDQIIKMDVELLVIEISYR